MIKDNDVFRIGTIQRPHGLHGEVEMRFTDDVFDRSGCEYLFLRIEGLFVPFFMEEYRFKSDEAVIMKFEHVDDEAAARRISGTEVYFPLSETVDHSEAPLTWNFLTGFTVFASVAGKIGIIKSVDSSNANILLHVQRIDGTEVLLPLHTDLVVGCDEKKRCLTLSLPEGLLSLNN